MRSVTKLSAADVTTCPEAREARLNDQVSASHAGTARSWSLQESSVNLRPALNRVHRPYLAASSGLSHRARARVAPPPAGRAVRIRLRQAPHLARSLPGASRRHCAGQSIDALYEPANESASDCHLLPLRTTQAGCPRAIESQAAAAGDTGHSGRSPLHQQRFRLARVPADAILGSYTSHRGSTSTGTWALSRRRARGRR